MKRHILILLFLFYSTDFYTQNFWEPTNGPFKIGYVSALNIMENGTIYVGIDKGGIYRSTDRGRSFSFVYGSFPATQFQNEFKFILANKKNYIFTSLLGSGIYRSTDDGNTWVKKLDGYFHRISLDSVDFIFAGGGSGFFRSTNDGDTWELVNSLPSGYVVTIATNPDGCIFVTIDVNTFISCDNGENWDPLFVPDDVYLTNFAFSNDGKLVAAFHPNNTADSSGFLISNDNGSTWYRKNIIKSYYGINTVKFDEPSNSFYAVLYDVTNWEIIKSSDFGNQWEYVSSIDYNQPDNFCLESDQQSYLFVGTIDGFKYSSDFGYNWVQSDSGFFVNKCEKLTLLPGNRLFVSTPSGVFNFKENLDFWVKDTSAIAGSFLVSINGDYFITWGSVYKSTNEGNTWIQVFNPSTPQYGDYSGVYETAQLSNGYLLTCGDTYFYPIIGTARARVWRSTDEGLTWDLVFTEDPDNHIKTIISIQNNIILAGGSFGVIKSTDSGITWFASLNGLPSNINVCVVRSNSNGVIFLGSTNSGIYISTDNGESWINKNNGLSSSYIKSIIFNSENKVFIGTPEGVFYSSNNGDTWPEINTGLKSLSVNSLICDSLDFIYAATNSSGVYKSVNMTTDVNLEITPAPINYKLLQNYPNPFNPSTKISYQLPNAGNVTLKVYSVLGRDVATLIDEYKNAGIYDVEFNGNKLPSGVYFYQLKAGDYVETKKMILVK
ncbi:MAG: T9SS type A sorting domain-containing protein [Ignavibacteriaceae bacterium]